MKRASWDLWKRIRDAKSKQRRYKKYKNEMNELMPLGRWPMSLDLQVKFLVLGEAAAPVGMRKM